MPVAYKRKFKQGVRRKLVGPYSRPSALTLLDGRCQVARDIKSLSEELSAHLGGNPSPAERLLVKMAAIKHAKIGLLVDKILTGEEEDLDIASRCFLAWANSLRRDLEALGLKAPTREAPSLKTYMGGKAA